MPEQPFKVWMARANDWCLTLAGVSVYDLADQPWRDWHEDWMAPEEAAELALEDEGYDVRGAKDMLPSRLVKGRTVGEVRRDEL